MAVLSSRPPGLAFCVLERRARLRAMQPQFTVAVALPRPLGLAHVLGWRIRSRLKNNAQNFELTAVNVDESTDGESVQNEADANAALKAIRLKNRNGLLILHLYIKSIRNKIEFLRPMTSETIDILVIAEIKIDNAFPTSQFMIEGFMKPYRCDQNQNRGGLLIYVRERAPIKELMQHKVPNDVECGIVEINLKN